MKCINCSTEHEGRFCPQCSQPAAVKRISWKQLLVELQERMLGVDNLFVRTVKDLTIQPNEVLKAVFAGNRRRYISPGAYLLLLLTLSILLFEAMGVSMADLYAPPPASASEEGAAFGAKLNEWIFENYRLTTFIMIPIYALFSLGMFRKAKLNMVEHAVIYAYATAHASWTTIVLLLFSPILSPDIFTWSFLISFAYTVWIQNGVFNPNKRWWFVLKSILFQGVVLLSTGILGALFAFAVLK